MTVPASLSQYLEIPRGYGGLGDRARIVATNLLSFSVQRGADPDLPGEFRFETQAATTALARRSIKLGTDPMGRFALTRRFSVYPGN